jgi:hypothetical protein
MVMFLSIVGAINWLAGVIAALSSLNLAMLFVINGSLLIGCACIVASVRSAHDGAKPTA